MSLPPGRIPSFLSPAQPDPTQSKYWLRALSPMHSSGNLHFLIKAHSALFVFLPALPLKSSVSCEQEPLPFLKPQQFHNSEIAFIKIVDSQKKILSTEISNKSHQPWLVWLSGLTECQPVNQRVTSLITIQGTFPSCRPGPPVGGTPEATTHCCFSPPLSPSLPLLLKINKQPWLVWLSGLSAGLRTKGSPV